MALEYTVDSEENIPEGFSEFYKEVDGKLPNIDKPEYKKLKRVYVLQK